MRGFRLFGGVCQDASFASTAEAKQGVGVAVWGLGLGCRA